MQPPDELRDILHVIPDAILDVRYASPDNFTGQQLYLHQVAWLRLEPLDALARAADQLRDSGYRIVIFDAYRPPAVQQKLRKACNNDNYVAEVSNHCRGITVDLALAGVDGLYLDMGTDYDDFSERAHADTTQITEQQRANRQLLVEAMATQGFVEHPYEWWHFDYRPDMEWNIVEDTLNVL